MRTCTGSSPPAHRGGAASCSKTSAFWGGAAFVVQRKRRALGGSVEVHGVDMNAANQLMALEDAVLTRGPTMAAYQRRNQAYKFQIALSIVFHKAVDPTILTDPPVTLRSAMAAVYPNELPKLVETSRHLLELLEVYEQNGSGWVFSNFVSMELTLWHLDPLRASAFVPLPKWIRNERETTGLSGPCWLDYIL